MSLKLITPPSAPAVTLAEAKAHLRVDVADEDALITSMVVAASEAAEQATGRALMPQTWEITLDAFPGAFELTRVPAASVTSLKYWNPAGVQTTLLNTLYALDSSDDFGPATVAPVFGASWPDARLQSAAVALRYVAGYADANAVPESIKAWIKLQVGAMFENRQAAGAVQTYELGFADRLLDRYRIYIA
jgi:uncharacterized phiE125 gp8 family phage protein